MGRSVAQMHDNEKIDDMIRGLLDKEALNIEPKEEIIGEIGVKLKNIEQDSKLKCIVKNNIFPMKLNIKGYVAAALLLFVLAPGLTLIFSKEARVAAAHGIDAVKNWVYVMIKAEDGYKPVKVEVNDDAGQFDIFYDYVGLTDEELSRKAGFNIHVPSELWGGYNCIQKIKGVRKSDNTIVNVIATYEHKNNTFGLMISMDNYIEVLQNKKEFDVKGTKFYWGEAGTDSIYPNHDMQQIPVGVKISHNLLWEYQGAFYRLYSSYEDITYDTAQKIAEHFMNNISNTYDKKDDAGVIRSQSILSKDATTEEIENEVGFKVKVPESLPGNFNIAYKIVGMDPMNNSCNMFKGEYNNGERTLNLIITEANWPVMEYDRIKDAEDDSRIIEVEGVECHWTYSDGSHVLGWMDKDVYYLIGHEKGDFSSIDEAVAIAKSIINNG